MIYTIGLVECSCQYTMETPEVKNTDTKTCTGTKLGLSLSLRDLRLTDDNRKGTRKHKSSNSRKLSSDEIRYLFNVILKKNS